MMQRVLEQEKLFQEANEMEPPRVMVIAEVGVNHDGDVGNAMELVDGAKAAGADAVKLQLFQPRRLLSNQAILAGYQKDGGAKGAYELLEGLMLCEEAMGEVVAYVKELGMKAVVTPFSLEDVEGASRLGVDVLKIASPDAVNWPLLREAAGLGKPMLISTGTCDLNELDFAAGILRNHEVGGAMLQCVSSYPTPLEEAGLGGMVCLKKHFGVAVGYSDHTQGKLTGMLAVGAGAVVIEKHLTYDCNAEGPDHAASMEVADFGDYVGLIREAEKMVGVRSKHVREVEKDVRLVSRQSVCVACDVEVGHVLKREDLTVKRPGSGVEAKRFEEVIGRQMRRCRSAGDLIREDDLVW